MSSNDDRASAKEPTPRYNGRTASELATDAEDNVRGIVHLAEGHETPLDPFAIYRALSGLTRLVDQLPEAVTRLSAAMIRHQETNRLAVSVGPFAADPAAAVTAMAEAVDSALAPFATARTRLGAAQAAVAEVRLAAP